MPTVAKQHPKKAPKKTTEEDNIINRIKPVHKLDAGLTFSIYGRSGSGKTVLACTFPKPLIIVGFENGTRSVHNVKGVDFVRITDTEDIPDLVKHFRNSDYKTAVIDTVTSMQDLLLKEILGLDEIPVEKSWGLATRDQYGQRSTKVKEILRSFMDLSETHSKNVVVLAQEGRGESDDDVASELVFPTVSSMLGKSAVGWLNPACNFIAQTFIRKEFVRKEVKIGGKSKIVNKETGNMQYCLRIGPHPVYTTKFRAPLGSNIPDVIVNPTYEKLDRLISGG